MYTQFRAAPILTAPAGESGIHLSFTPGDQEPQQITGFSPKMQTYLSNLSQTLEIVWLSLCWTQRQTWSLPSWFAAFFLSYLSQARALHLMPPVFLLSSGFVSLFSYLEPHYSLQIWFLKLSFWVEPWLSFNPRLVKFSFLLLWLINHLSHPTWPQKALSQVKSFGKLSYLHSANSN